VTRDEDYKLIEKVANKDMDALDLLAKRHQKVLYEYAVRVLGSREGAEDIVQETFLRAAKYANRYKPTAKVITWLLKISHNLCIDKRRGDSKSTIPIEAAEHNLFAYDRNLESLENRELSRAIQNAVNELPERQREALILHRYQGLSHIEISKVTGWSRSAVESLIIRAYDNLRKNILKKRNIKDFLQD
jgi:RNA polymerase sigma-70 factor (ECF subfamily)